jgi:hypothetical protein
MGGAKSKPYQSAAASLISRRAKEGLGAQAQAPTTQAASMEQATAAIAEEAAHRPYGGHTPTARETIARINSINAEIEPEKPMDPAILKEMSSWATITSKPDEINYKLLREKGEDMAVVIRHKDDMALVKKFGRIPKNLAGKVTEMQLVKLMKAALDKPAANTASKIAEEYNLNELPVKHMLKYARHAVVTQQKANPGLLIGR